MKTLIRFLLLLLSSSAGVTISGESPAKTVKVGVIVDLSTAVGRGALAAMSLSLSDFYSEHPSSAARVVLLPRNASGSDAIGAASIAFDLISNHQVSAIIGPQTSSTAAFVADLGSRAQIPVVSFSATSPLLSPSLSPFFIRAVPSDSGMGPSIAAIASAFSWRRIVPIHEDTDFGSSLLPSLLEALSSSDISIPYRCAIPPSASADLIGKELYRLKTLQTRVFVLHANSSLSARILSAASQSGMVQRDYAWILSSAVTAQIGSIDLASIQGGIGVRPFINRADPAVRDFEIRWRVEYLRQNPNLTSEAVYSGTISPYVYYAYDALWAVAKAANAASGTLISEIQRAEFDGISGRFRLEDGELRVAAYQIVNVNGEAVRGIGFWTAERGLAKRLEGDGEAEYSKSREDLGPVIWPGETAAPPKGWEAPTGERKVRFAVPGPVEPGFRPFLSMDVDPATGKVVAGGYVIDVFEAAVRRLPYALSFEYVPPPVTGGSKAATDYDALVKAVFHQEVDGVVGDVTITANRSEYAAFTFPYTVSGVSMLVPVRNVRSHRAWAFLKPLTSDLWLISASFFFLTGLVVWFLEHRINDDFRGPPSYQLGTVFFFSFSSLVFAHKEEILSNLSKLVMTVWVFVVLILTSSYTASLTSMLTVQQFKPAISDNLHELILRGDPVGHLRHSFVKGLLLKLGFHEKQLYGYKSPEEYREALSNGSVVAIIDEIPYLKLFLKSFCDNFTMSSPLYKTSGFGFVFPRGSSLIPDLSRAILSLTESDEMEEIGRRWFGDLSSCPAGHGSDGGGSISASNSLDFGSFYGLFLITGAASALALVAYSVSFCFRHRADLAAVFAAKMTFGRRLRSVARFYDGKDLSCHAFKDSSGKTGASAGQGKSPRFDSDKFRSPFSVSQLGTDAPSSPESGSPLSASSFLSDARRGGADNGVARLRHQGEW